MIISTSSTGPEPRKVQSDPKSDFSTRKEVTFHPLFRAKKSLVGVTFDSRRGKPLESGKVATLLTYFHASFFPFCPLCWPPLFLPFARHLFALFSASKSALFCRAKDTAQSLERASLRMDLSTKFGKEVPSRDLRKEGQSMTLFSVNGEIVL